MGSNEIDAETLQAQIDLSMSLANDIVDSWMQPSAKPPESNGKFETEIKEYLRRPPRLGVGAKVTGNIDQVREVNRLRENLVTKDKASHSIALQKKRPKPEDSDDDVDESRSFVIKTKAKPDPFASKNAKVNVKDVTDPKRTKGLHIPTQTIPVTPVKSRALSDVLSPMDSAADDDEVADELLASSPVRPNQPDTSQTRHLTPKMARAISISPFTTPESPAKSVREQLRTEILKRPLLNLDGPPPENADYHDDNMQSSPKRRKRRRHKKKRNLDSPPPSNADDK